MILASWNENKAMTAQKNEVFYYGFLQETTDLVTFTEKNP